jgi:hypothetical protein
VLLACSEEPVGEATRQAQNTQAVEMKGSAHRYGLLENNKVMKAVY